MKSSGQICLAMLSCTRRFLCCTSIYFLLLFYTPARAQPFAYQFDHLTVDEGLSHTDANCIVQDEKGFIWVGTLFGINRFDGYNLKRYYNNNEPLKNAYKNRVKYLLPDNNGQLWVSTEDGLQLFDSKTETYTEFPVANTGAQPSFVKLIKSGRNLIYNLSDGNLALYTIANKHLIRHALAIPAGVRFNDMQKDARGDIYLASSSGIFLLDKNKRIRKLLIKDFPDEGATRIHINRDGELLICNNNKLYTIAQNADAYKTINTYINTEGSNLVQIGEEANGNYWINGGSCIINVSHDLKPLQLITSQTPGVRLNSRSLTDLIIDRSGCLWITAYGGGVRYRDLNKKKFLTFQHRDGDANSITSSNVRSVLEEPGKGLWLGTENGLNFYDYKSKRNYVYNDRTAIFVKNNNILALALDRTSNLWVGTGSGISILSADRKSVVKPAGYANFPNYSIETLANDMYGNIWFGNHTNSFGVIWRDKNGVYQVRYYGEGYFILPDVKRPELFVSSTRGLKRLLVDEQGHILKTYNYRAKNGKGLSSDYTYPVGKQNDSVYWVGTIGGGLNKIVFKNPAVYTVRHYAAKAGVFNDVEALEIDKAGRIWMGGNGLLCLDPKTEQVTRYDKNDGLQGNSFKVGASYKDVKGNLYFGGTNGLNYFEPTDIVASAQKVHPILTDLLINNKKPGYGRQDADGNVLPQIITYTKNLKLNYQQNNFVIFFSAMHFGNPLKCRYRYKLVGFDKDWKYTNGKNPGAFYSNLDHNTYQFVVEATNPDGVWTDEQASVAITITPPWWTSAVAKLLYLLLFVSGLAWIYIYQARWYQLKRELAIRALNEAKREEIHLHKEELYQQQLQFFTNISHELRTPLTLILGPLEGLLNSNTDRSLTSSFQLMFRNIKRLVNLINELMNFKKTADGAIKLQVRPLNILDFSKGLFAEFEQLAASKNIRFTFNSDQLIREQVKVTSLFDAQILEKILFNLLSNALKYTNAGGAVTLSIFFDKDAFRPKFDTGYHLTNEEHRAQRYVYLLVADTGIGISKDSISSIFDRYYQISTAHLGSGVGLALVRSLTMLHKGDISVYSERNQGTQFLVALPWGADNYKPEEYARTDEHIASRLERTDVLPFSSISTMVSLEEPSSQKIDKHILLVDDNAELRAFLKQALEKFYFIAEAADGAEAIRLATERSPDLIISDVMMPGMNGIELCQAIKEKFETSHIPFIILSAKDALETKIEGMTSGADFYFAKPFSIDLLLLTVHNLFQQSQKLKLKYTRDHLTSAIELVHTEKDKEFMDKLLNLIEANIEQPDLDVDFLCANLYISRSKLYQKIKGISDQSIGDFIKTIRLKKAIQLMTHEVMPLNEVAFRSGFQSQGYFSRVFRKEFGKSPSEYMRDLMNDQPGT